jgi:hypothetical protein
MTSNQARFDGYSFPFRKQKMVEQFQSDNSTDILYKKPLDVKWIPYNKLHIANYTRAHYDSTSDVMVMRVNTEVNTYTRVTQRQWLLDKLSLEAARAEELQANFAGISHRTLKGLPPSIDPDRPPKAT